MPPVPPERREPDGSPSPTSPNDVVPCSYCIGVSVYTRAMWRNRQTPECRGLQVNFVSSRERLQDMRERAAHPRKDNFAFIGVGISAYTPEWMEEGKHLPHVKGIGLIAVRIEDNDEFMKHIEERKRIKRELQKDAGSKGDLQDGEDDKDDEVDGFDDGEVTEDGQALVESEVVHALKTPRGPAVVPASITMGEVKNSFVKKTKYSVNAMYKFWERRLDGFSDRYLNSCRRLTEQMDKQAVNTSRNLTRLIHRIDEYVFGKDGDDKE